MKIESYDHTLADFFTQRNHGKDPGNVLELERSQAVLENLLRWADDGGRMPDIGNHLIARLKPDTARDRVSE